MKTADEIIYQVRAFCLRENLLAGGHIIAAVSGGADSMALLRALLVLREEFGYTLTACHVNHGLRGASADADEAFVRAECARLGVPLRVFHAREVEGFDQPPAHAGEDWARRLRYACFARARAESGGIAALATAHTCTDQAETLLFRLARGTGLHGAAGIRPAREGLIRPLLCLTREDTEALCEALGQQWVTDETNDTDAYARNRLRRGALPALRSANGAAEKNLARFCEAAARADEYFSREARALLARANAGEGRWALEPLQQADALILEAALHSLVAPERDAEEKYIALLAALVRRGSGAVQLTARVRFCAGAGEFWREELSKKAPASVAPPQAFAPEKQAEYSLSGGWKVRASLLAPSFEEKTQRIHKKDLKNQADYAKISALYPALTLRCRQPGDKYAPAGRGVHKDLRKWMNEAGIPPHERETLPLLACGSEVLWVCGAGFAEGLAPTAHSARVLQLTPQKMEEVHVCIV